VVDEHVIDGKVDPWRWLLAAAVARGAGGQIVWAPGGHGRSQGRIFFYGPAGAVGGMVDLYRYLEAQLVVISAAATAARRERWVHGRAWRNSFLLGAVARVAQRPPAAPHPQQRRRRANDLLRSPPGARARWIRTHRHPCRSRNGETLAR
jgi:hypothetical protein